MRVFKRSIAILCTVACMAGMMPATTYATVGDDTQNTQATNTSQAANTTQPTNTTQAAKTTTSNVKVVTKKKSLPKTTNKDKVVVKIKSSKGYRTYKIYHQKGKGISKNSYLFQHGCATSALTTVLSAYSSKYANITPKQTYSVLEKQVLGIQAWNKNYKKARTKRMPLSLYGVSTMLTRLGINNTYVPYFTNASAAAQIRKHLYSGNPVVITVNCYIQRNGKFSRRYTNKWTNGKHTMTLVGMADNGKAIVADSSNRTWSKKEQRIKYVSVGEIVKYMYPSKNYNTRYYYKGNYTSGGYVLVNPQ